MNEAVILWLKDKKRAVESWNFEKVIKKIRHYDLICNYCGEAVVFDKEDYQ